MQQGIFSKNTVGDILGLERHSYLTLVGECPKGNLLQASWQYDIVL